MVEDIERTDQCFYSIAFLDHWLYNFGDLCALAESPSTAYGLTSSRPTPATPHTGARQKGFSGDRLGWACVRADIERAWGTLEGLQLNTVWARTRGFTMERYALHIQRRRQTVDEAYRSALDQMAAMLNGQRS